MLKRKRILHPIIKISLFPFILPDTTSALRSFEEQYPNIRLEVIPLTNDEAIDAVEAGQLDCACIIRMACADQPPLQHTLVTFDAGVDFADDSPLAGRAEVQLRDLTGMRCIGMGSLEKTLRPVHRACLAQGVTLDYAPIHSTVDAFLSDPARAGGRLRHLPAGRARL